MGLFDFWSVNLLETKFKYEIMLNLQSIWRSVISKIQRGKR